MQFYGIQFLAIFRLTIVLLDYKCDRYNLIKPMGIRDQTALDSNFFSHAVCIATFTLLPGFSLKDEHQCKNLWLYQ